METYDINVAGVKRSLPVVPISDTVSIASFVIFGDTEIVEPCARELAIAAGGQEGERSTYGAVAPAPWEVWNPLGR